MLVLDEVEAALAELELAELVATDTGTVVVTTVVTACIVVANTVVPGNVEACCVDGETVLAGITLVSVELDTSVDIVVAGIVEAGMMLPEIVESAIVVGDTVLAGRVVVYVRVTSPPRTLAGITLPTPEAVYWLGIGRVAVFGCAASLSAYILPVVPFTRVYAPVSRFAVSPAADV